MTRALSSPAGRRLMAGLPSALLETSVRFVGSTRLPHNVDTLHPAGVTIGA